MSSVSFTYAGKRKKIKVPESFWALSEAEKADFLDGVMQQKDRPKPSGGTGSALLDTLSLLERPAQALKVGIRETGIGGYDPTPEGFLAGMGKGWRGEDTVRTQEFMSKHFRTEHPWLAGIGGFVGDVLTDPLTYVGAGAVKLMGKGLTSAYGVLPGSTALTSAVSKLPYTETAGIGRGIRGVGRAFNVPITAEEKAAKQAADIARAGGAFKTKPPPEFGMRVTDPRLEESGQFITNEAIRLNRMGAFREHSLFTPRELKKELKLLEKFFKKRAKDTGIDKSMLHTSFRDFMEKALDENLEQIVVSDVFMGVLGQTGIDLATKWAKYMHRAKSIENDFALRIPEFGRQMEIFGGPTGYFPKVVTKEGRQYHQLGKEDVGGVGSAGYQHRFTHDTVQGYNKFGKQFGVEQTFYENPVVALGIRLDDHHKAIQKQWFVDQVTDAHNSSTWLRGQAGIPLLNLGRYVGKDTNNNPTVLAFGDHFGKGKSEWHQISVTEDLYAEAFSANKMLEAGQKLSLRQEEVLRQVSILRHNGVRNLDDLKKWKPVTGVRSRMGEGKLRPDDFEAAPGPKRDPRSGQWTSKLERHSWFATPMDDVEEVRKLSWHAPEEVGKAVSNHLNIMGNHKGQIDDFLKFYDAVQNGWKGWSLAVRPAYHIRNVVGNMFNAYTIAGITNPAHFINAFKLQRAGSKGELGTTTGFNGIRGESMESIAQSGQRNGVVGGQYTDDIRRTEEDRILARVGKGGLERTGRVFGQDNPMVALGFTAGEALESNARWGVYLAKLKSIRSNPSRHTWEAPDGTKIKLSNKGALAKWGIDPKEAGYQVAARDVKEALFDYGDISVFERNSMKRLMPFYTWTRKNIPAQIKHLVLNPQRAEKLHLAREQFEFAGGRPEFRDIAPFWGNRVPIFFGQETQGVRGLFTLLNTVPLADLERLHKPAELLADLASPILKQSLEQLSNYDLFRKRAIREYKGEKKDFMGVALPPWAWHLVQVLVPIAEINRVNPGGIFGEQVVDPITGMQTISPGFGGIVASRESGPVDIGAAARMVRFFTGGRAYDINIEQQRGFRALTLMKDLRRLKSMLKWAAAKGEERKVKEIYDLLEAVLNQEEEDPFLRRR